MPDTDKDKQDQPVSGGYAGIVDAGSRAARTITDAQPSGILNLIAILALIVLCGLLGVKVWSEMEENRENRRERQESEAVRIRDQNARDELTRQQHNMQMEAVRTHCAGENEKTRKESAEQIKMVLNAFLTEGDRQRTFISAENEKFRKEVMTALKQHGGPPGGP